MCAESASWPQPSHERIVEFEVFDMREIVEEELRRSNPPSRCALRPTGAPQDDKLLF